MFGRKPVVVETPIRQMAEPKAELSAPANPISAMAATAVRVEAVVSDEADRLRALLPTLLEVELDAKTRVERRLEELEASGMPYPKISLEPLEWRRDGLPIFAVHTLTSAFCSLPDTDWMHGRRGVLPGPISAALEKDVDFGRSFSQVGYLSQFTGLIPSDVRQKIAEAREHFGENIYIVAEANWKQVPRPAGDPLIVGWKAASLWLVAQFDLTDIERYVISEFPG